MLNFNCYILYSGNEDEVFINVKVFLQRLFRKYIIEQNKEKYLFLKSLNILNYS